MKRMLIALAMVGLSGCATYSELQDRPPLRHSHTDKAPQAFAECVLPKWMSLNASSHLVPEGDSRIVVVPGQGPFAGDTVASLTISPAGSGSDVDYRTPVGAGFPGPTNQWASAEACM